MKLWSVQIFSQTNTCCEENILLCRDSIGIFCSEDARKSIADWIEGQVLGYSESDITRIIDHAMNEQDIISLDNKTCKCTEFLLVEQVTCGEMTTSGYDLIDNTTPIKEILAMKTEDQVIAEVREVLKKHGVQKKLQQWLSEMKSRVS